MNEFCDFCGTEIHQFHGMHSSLTRFCCEEHRVAYHNQMRKIERKISTIEKQLGDLFRILADEDQEGLHNIVLRQLVRAKMFSDYHPKLGLVQVKCLSCGLTADMPGGKFTCNECQSDKYAFHRLWKMSQEEV